MKGSAGLAIALIILLILWSRARAEPTPPVPPVNGEPPIPPEPPPEGFGSLMVIVISGTRIYMRNAIEGAVVTVAGRTAITDARGSVYFDHHTIPAGTQMVMASHPAHILATKPVTIRKNSTSKLYILMERI